MDSDYESDLEFRAKEGLRTLCTRAPIPPVEVKQQRIETSFNAPAQKRRRLSRKGKFPVVDTLRQTPISGVYSMAQTGTASKRIVIDLFACIGGFSTGAAIAGHQIGLAVDCDPQALAIHEANHPNAVHKVMLLGPETETELIELIRSVVPAGSEWHLHGSPPCTKLSSARQMSVRSKDVVEKGEHEGMCLVDWYLNFSAKMEPTSWSMEQVNCAPVRTTLKERRLRSKSWTDFEVVEFAKFGVPQTRTRIIAGLPSLIRRIRFGKGMLVSKLVTPRMVITDLPTDAVYVRGNWHRETKQDATESACNGGFINERAQALCRTLDEPSWTVMANQPLQWWDSKFARIRGMNIKETLLMQTFPQDYKEASGGSMIADFLKGIGNAVPPLFASKLMAVVSPHGVGVHSGSSSSAAAAAAASGLA